MEWAKPKTNFPTNTFNLFEVLKNRIAMNAVKDQRRKVKSSLYR